jgi:hypothetical protein
VLDGSLDDWQGVVDLALPFSTAYRRAGDLTHNLCNAALLDGVHVRDDHVVGAAYKEPSDLVCSSPNFEYGEMVGLAGLEPATSALSVPRSNQLSYSPSVLDPVGSELVTYWSEDTTAAALSFSFGPIAITRTPVASLPCLAMSATGVLIMTPEEETSNKSSPSLAKSAAATTPRAGARRIPLTPCPPLPWLEN